VDAALARKWNSVGFSGCRLSPASVPALTRLLGSSTLTELGISQYEAFLDAPSAALLGDALRGNSTLTTFRFDAQLWQNADAAATLLGALTGHSSLRTLKLSNRAVAGAPAAGAPLGTLVGANAPALTQLYVGFSDLGDAGLRPLFEALPRNTYLRTLDISRNGISSDFARDVLLPAVRANTGLRELIILDVGAAAGNCAFRREAQALLAARRAAAAAAAK
jgi:hypothetical protein